MVVKLNKIEISDAWNKDDIKFHISTLRNTAYLKIIYYLD